MPVSSQGGKQVLRLIPRDRQSLAVGAIEVAARHNWIVTEMRSDPGRLDEVFRALTHQALEAA